MLDWSKCSGKSSAFLESQRSLALFSGAHGVPVTALFENLEGGATVDNFLEVVSRRHPRASRVRPETRGAKFDRCIKKWPKKAVMNILFDQGTPAPLRKCLAPHRVSTAFEMEWAKLENGDLLSAAEKVFDAFISTDKNLRYQQNLRWPIILAIVILPRQIG